MPRSSWLPHAGLALLSVGCGDPAPPGPAPTPAPVTAPAAPAAAPTADAAAEASAPEAPRVARELLILSGGTDAATVERWRADHADALAALYGDPAALPIFKSDGVEGLKPGFFILAPSACPAADADAAFAAALRSIPGAYTRTVQVAADFGACRMAGEADWWSLSLHDNDPLCTLVRTPLKPAPEPELDDPHVLPPPPDGYQELQFLDGPCPTWWSAVRADRSDLLLLNVHASPTLGLATHAHLVDLGAEGQAELLDPKGDLESVTFEGEVPVFHFLDSELEEEPSSEAMRVEAVYTGSLQALFERWGLEDRRVTGLAEAAVRATVPADSVQAFACVDAHRDGGAWVERARRIVTSFEGSLAPYCTTVRPVNNHGFADDVLRGQHVPQDLTAAFNAAAGAPAGTQWTFVGLSGAGEGDLAVSTHTEIGSNLTGFAVAYDGTTARRFDGLKGILTNLRHLDPGRALLCTDRGYGAVEGRTGETLWWEPARDCPVVFRD